jgi:hypothetical protein
MNVAVNCQLWQAFSTVDLRTRMGTLFFRRELLADTWGINRRAPSISAISSEIPA